MALIILNGQFAWDSRPSTTAVVEISVCSYANSFYIALKYYASISRSNFHLRSRLPKHLHPEELHTMSQQLSPLAVTSILFHCNVSPHPNLGVTVSAQPISTELQS